MSLSERCFRALWEKDKDKTRHKDKREALR